MKIRLLTVGVAAAAILSAAPASAATFVLNNIGGVTVGSQAYNGFMTAANFWGSRITNNITINLNVGFQSLGASTLGQTSSSEGFASTSSVLSRMAAVASGDTVDTLAMAHLPVLSSSGGLSVYTLNGNTSGPVAFGSTPALDNNNTANNTTMEITTANAKALGYSVTPGTVDGVIDFSSDFSFDFNSSNGISAGSVDFLGVALHEIGHALGFISGVDALDQADTNFHDQSTVTGSTLDLFRYAHTGPAGAAELTWAPGIASYFSLDGGATSAGCGFSTGASHGDGWQASHWQRLGAGGSPCGIMDPATAYGQQDAVSSLDFIALDAIGYNFTFDPGLTTGSVTTAFIQDHFGFVNSVPEPSVWALLIVGFGLTGASLRRNRRRLTIA